MKGALKNDKKYDILIVGNKNPIMARELLSEIKHLNVNIEVIDSWISKKEFQIKLAQSHMSVHLPKKIEEHYIPGVEAMMLDSLVIIPDCIGNRSYSKHNETCYISEYNIESMAKTIYSMIDISENLKKQLLKNAKKESKLFTLENERDVILRALKMTTKMW